MEDDNNNTLIIRLETGEIVIQLFPDVAPLHVERIKTLALADEYDNVAFHRVLDGFVAQTGDVEFGDLEDGYDPLRVGTGGSDLPDLPIELSDISFERAVVGMARAQALDSANSQFFIMLEDEPGLDGRFTVFGEVVNGMQYVDAIKLGVPPSGLVTNPDRMVDVIVTFDGAGLGLGIAEAQAVAFLYEAGLNRNGEIDLEGLNFWIEAREGGLSVEDTAQFFLDSPEFEAAFGDPDALSDRELVELLYLNVLDRPGEEAGVEFWTEVVGQEDFSRAELLYAFAVSVENAETLEFVETLTQVGLEEWAFVA